MKIQGTKDLAEKKGGGKAVGRKVLHSKECQLIHAEGMMKLEYYHFATPDIN